MMRFGFPVWRGSGSLRKVLNSLRRAGFDFAEIDLETQTPEELGLSKPLMPTGYHAPYTMPLTHLYLGKASKEKFLRLVKFAERNGALYLNIHVNYPHYRGLESLNERLRKETMGALRELRRRARSIVLTLENPPRGDYWRCQAVREIAEAAGVKLCLDVGHVAYAMLRDGLDVGRVTREIKRCIKTNKDLLYLVHLHNISQKTKSGEVQDHVLRGELDLLEIAEHVLDTECRYILLEIFFRDASGRKEAKLEDVSAVLRRLRRGLNLK